MIRPVALLLIATSVLAQDYTNSGSDWVAPCASSNTQSPIDFTLTRFPDQNLELLNFHLNDWTGSLTVETALVFMNKPQGTTSQVEVTYNGSKCVYDALRFEFHAPAQHKLNTVVHPLEMQLIFQRIDSSCTTHPEYVAVAVLFRTTNNVDSAFLTGIGIPSTGSGTATLQTNLEALHSDGFNTYPGSLTSDTCAEVTHWAVGRTILDMSTTQLNYFDSKWKNNAGFAGGNGNNRVAQVSNARDDYTIDQARVVFNQPFSGSSGGIMSAVTNTLVISILGFLLLL